jgi:hypothetical protein
MDSGPSDNGGYIDGETLQGNADVEYLDTHAQRDQGSAPTPVTKEMWWPN